MLFYVGNFIINPEHLSEMSSIPHFYSMMPTDDTYASPDQTAIGWDSGLSLVWCQVIIWTIASILLIGSLVTM